MPFPQFPDKHSHPSALTGADIVNYRRGIGKFPEGKAPESVLICLETSLPARMKRRYPFKKIGRFVGDLLLLSRSGGRVGVMSNFGVGAPVVVGMAEELAAWGTRQFALLSWAGGLQPDLAEGDVVVIQDALRDDGVSQHYLADSPSVSADETLTAKLLQTLEGSGQPHRSGRSWTISAPYRETTAELQRYQSEGVLTVEMEAAALFAFGFASGLGTLAAVVVGDRFADQTWQPPQDVQRVHSSLDTVYSAILDTLMQL